METKMKRCKQCGRIQAETQYRKYYNGKGGRYRTCLSCERINARHKYLHKKLKEETPLSAEETQELNKIEELFELLRDQGLKPPEKKQAKSVVDDVEALMMERMTVAETSQEDGPEELQEWLGKDLTGFSPDYLQDEVADELITKYRPQTGVDPVSYAPIYDETHRDILNEVLKRFDDYEDDVND